MNKHLLLSKKTGIIAAIATITVFILAAAANGIISNITTIFTNWLWELVVKSIKTSSIVWIISLMGVILLQFAFIIINNIFWHHSKENNIDLEEKKIEIGIKNKELDTLNKQLQIKDKTVNELETKITTFLQSDNLLVDRLHTGIHRVFPQTVNFDWMPYINNANHVTMVRIRHSFSEDPLYYQAFEAILARKGSVTLVMADPRSHPMRLRYMEERVTRLTGNHPGETTWVDGLGDLSIVLYRLYNWRQRLIQEGRDISKLSIKIASNYPSQAYYRFDNQIIFYHYPYHERGFHSPAFLFTDPATSVHRFLCQCINSVVNDSLSLEKEIDDIWKKYQEGFFSDREVLKYHLTISKYRR